MANESKRIQPKGVLLDFISADIFGFVDIDGVRKFLTTTQLCKQYGLSVSRGVHYLQKYNTEELRQRFIAAFHPAGRLRPA